MANWLWSRKEKDEGFSLVELLIVVIIMGILAAVAIPLFMQQRAKAEDSAARADARTLANEVSTYWADHAVGAASPDITYASGQYTIGPAGDTTTTPASKNITASGYVVSGTGATGTEERQTWCVFVQNNSGKLKDFSISAYGGLKEGTAVQCGPGGGGSST
ncbi:MAG: type II secretion system GspH family protein [Bifidobacteriaceae bacterium]|jgi:prepilin-type N-terminal cleavage/methylation domain-containing protein|nr:type II secretion system GspH family protein [Bifidobacteriaceae bacterium]